VRAGKSSHHTSSLSHAAVQRFASRLTRRYRVLMVRMTRRLRRNEASRILWVSPARSPVGTLCVRYVAAQVGGKTVKDTHRRPRRQRGAA
jgi:hypothetical protein